MLLFDILALHFLNINFIIVFLIEFKTFCTALHRFGEPIERLWHDGYALV